MSDGKGNREKRKAVSISKSLITRQGKSKLVFLGEATSIVGTYLVS